MTSQAALPAEHFDDAEAIITEPEPESGTESVREPEATAVG
ncbi:hypothetical protein AB0I51_09325 [Streptomyces sp. NPDC050549]